MGTYQITKTYDTKEKCIEYLEKVKKVYKKRKPKSKKK